MISRRDLVKIAGQSVIAAGCAPFASSLITMNNFSRSSAVRCINVVNFIRGVEPRFETDLLLPVRKQMELILAHKLPATWLLQYDALVSGPFVEFLKAHKAPDHEVGIWFEMNEMHCKAANVEWRGRPGYEWDHYPLVAFTIGYTPEERVKLADAFMRTFKSVWGHYPSSVASWNLDSITMAHLTEHYGIDAYAVCRDQIATDGFTIWGAPIAGYYPNKTNCWSPAISKSNQIQTPMFRMLGQDPVYYYEKEFSLPDGKRIGEPDTMEPVWTSGRSPLFVDEFLKMIADAPTGQFAYAQLGQENSFPWPEMEPGYAPQMEALAKLREAGTVHVETMGESGRRFKKAFATTPVQAQVQISDPFGNTNPAETTVWYQSRIYRANLHFKGDLPYLRDLTVYSDQYSQPFLTKATRLHEVEQRMPSLLDGYHWSKEHGADKEPGAGCFFEVGGKRLRLTGKPKIHESGKSLIAELPVQDGNVLTIRFEEDKVELHLTPDADTLTASFEWDPAKASLIEVQPQQAKYRWQEFNYSLGIRIGTAQSTEKGFLVSGGKGLVELRLSQALG